MVNDKTTNYHYDQGINVLFETDSSGNITAEYAYNRDGMPAMMIKDAKMYYYVYNSTNDIIALSDTSGIVVASYTYDVWGNILSQSGPMATSNPLRYKGYRYDEETGLYYLIARYYKPQEAVFLSTDPEDGDLYKPQTQNGYNYVSNNPVMLVDPDGRKELNQGPGGGGGVPFSTYQRMTGKGTYKGTIPKNTIKLPTSYNAAKSVSKKLGGTVTQLKNGYKVEIKNGKKPIVIRIMNAGSGGRTKPYFRVSRDGKGSYTLSGKISKDKGLTHIDMNSNYKNQITKIVNSIKGK